MAYCSIAAWLVQIVTSTAPSLPDPDPLVVPELSNVSVAPVIEAGGAGFSYTFLEAGATRLDLEDIDDEADTYYGLASLGLFDLAYVFLGYENQAVDFDDATTDVWSLGAGVHFGLLARLDLEGDVALLYSELDGDTLDESDSGTRMRVGARWLPLEFGRGGLELSGHALWVGLDDTLMSDDEVLGFDAGARVHFGPLSVGAGYENLEDDDRGAVNLRFSF